MKRSAILVAAMIIFASAIALLQGGEQPAARSTAPVNLTATVTEVPSGGQPSGGGPSGGIGAIPSNVTPSQNATPPAPSQPANVTPGGEVGPMVAFIEARTGIPIGYSIVAIALLIYALVSVFKSRRRRKKSLKRLNR